MRERNHLEDVGINASIIFKSILTKSDGRTWNGSTSLRIGTGGGLL